MNPINAWELSLPSYRQTSVNEATFTAVIFFLRGIMKWATEQPVISAFPQFFLLWVDYNFKLEASVERPTAGTCAPSVSYRSADEQLQ